MSWAQGRQLAVISIIVAVVLAIVALIAIPLFYRTPTCFDTKQNQKETGVDCGGPCGRVCSSDALPPRVSFVRALVPEAGRTDVIAYVENRNQTAYAAHVRATVDLYDSTHTLIQSKDISIDLAPGAVAPVFIPRFYEGSAIATQSFLTIDDSSLIWIRTATTPVVPLASQIMLDTSSSMPRLTAILSNPIARKLSNVQVVATLFDADNNAIAASRTLVPSLPSQGTAPLIFTWNQPFSSVPVREELRSVPLFVAGSN